MPKILIPPKTGSPKECEGRKPPQLQGAYYEFDLTMEEYKFWKGLTSADREKLRTAAFERCFYEALHEIMQTRPRSTVGLFSSRT
ncbi:MAG TPA: hypothetical protein VJN71_09240 [Nitrososphaerales archaeon]|nr:hypothetical protein [Nitrososphaerales archaeon]